MDIGKENGGEEPCTCTAFSTWEPQGEASEDWSMRWRRATGELSPLDRLKCWSAVASGELDMLVLTADDVRPSA